MSDTDRDDRAETLAAFDRASEPHAPFTTAEVAETLSVSRRTAYNRLERLVDSGDLRTKKVGARGRVWWRPRPADGRSRDDDFGRMLSRLVDNVPGIVYRCENEPGWPLTFVNDGCLEVTGYESDAIDAAGELVHPDDVDRVDREIQEQLAESDHYSVRFRILDADDEVRWMEDRGYGIVDDDSGDVVALEGVTIDITERERAKQALAEREQLFRSMVEATEEYAIFMLDVDGRVRTWNRGAEYTSGYEREEVLGEHVSTFYTADAVGEDAPERNLRAAATNGSVESGEWWVRTDGSRFWARTTITAIRDRDGDLEGYAVVTRDMTDRREYEQRINAQRNELERELDEVLERIDDGFYAVDDELAFTYVNERAETLFRTTRSELIGEPVLEAFPAAVRSDVHDDLRRALDTQRPVSDELYLDSRARWIELRIYPSETGLSIYFRDVTDRKEMEQSLRETEAKFGQLAENVTEVVWISSPELDEFHYVNPAYEEVWNHSLETLYERPRSFLGRIHPDDRRRVAETISDRSRGEYEEEYRIVHSDGTIRWLRDRSYPIRDEDGTVFRIVGIAKDVTERKERERALERSERRYRTLAENFPNGAVALFNGDLEFTLVEGQIFDEIDLSPDALTGTHVSEAFDPDDAPLAVSKYREAIEGTPTTFEVTIDGRRFRVWVLPIDDEGGDVFAGMAMSQDITERLRYEEQLRTLNEATGELLGATTKSAVSEIVIDAATDVLDLSDVLLYRYDDAEELLVPDAQSVEARLVPGPLPNVPPDGNSIIGHTFAEDELRYYDDVRESTHLLSDGTEMRAGLFVPITGHGVLIAGSRTVGSIDERTRQLVAILAADAEAAFERVDRERTLERQRRRVTALNDLNDAVLETTNAILGQSTREEIEQVVCDSVVESTSYRYAWLAEVDARAGAIDPLAEAGLEGYAEEISISFDPDAPEGQGPAGRAIRTQETQVVHDLFEDPVFEPWREHAAEYGFRSAAAIPISHEETLYGVLLLYAEQVGAFGTDERAVIGQLGDIVGHAIAAAERKHALAADNVIELEVQIRNVLESTRESSDAERRIVIDHTVPLADGEYLQYGTVVEGGTRALDALVEQRPAWMDVRAVGNELTADWFEARLSQPPFLSTILSHDGSVERAVIENDDYRITIHLPNGTDVRHVIEAMRETHPTAEVLARRRRSLSMPPSQRITRTWLSELTDKQRTTLETAYVAGFFEWPRKQSGKEIAASLDVSAATFSQHIRAAERKLFGALFEDRPGSE